MNRIESLPPAPSARGEITPPHIRDDGESVFKSRGGLSRLVNALRYSLAGLSEAVRVESAFRQELILAVVLLPLAAWLPVTAVERVLLIGVVLLLLVVELLNSALEAVVDRISLAIHDMSRRAKDFGSAAVFVTLALVAIVWGMIGVPALLRVLN